MTPIFVHRQEQALDSLIVRADALTPGDPLQAYLTQFICVRVSGFIERAVATIYLEYARRYQPSFARFVSRRIERLGNPNAENLCQLAGDFDSAWEEALRDYLDLGGRGAAVNSVVTNRHRIAHGESTSFGLWQLKDWYRKVLEYIRFIEAQVGV